MKIIKLTRLPIVLTALTLLAGLILASTKAKADDSIVSNVSITVPVSCNLNSTVDTPHAATINPGTMQENIGTTTFKVFCNDNNGFSVYANGYSGEENGNTKMLATVNNVLSPTDDIVTGTATSGSTSNWAMKLTKVAGLYEPTILSDTNGSYEAYHTIPTDWTKIATLPGNTDFTSGSSFQTTYRAYISRTQPAGTYQGKVKYMMVHPASAAVPINFNDAYAAAGKTKLNGYYQMQDMDANICDAVNVFDEPSQTQLIDARDNKLYYVAKLKDGECWMTQNLDHDISTSFAYTPDNTDIPANWTPDKSTYPTSTTTWDTNSTGNNIQQSYDPGNKIWDGTPSSSSLNLDNMTQGTNQHYHIGNYYNFGAAVAMNNTASYTTQNQDVNQSICPKGWTLPKSGNNTSAGSFQYLVNQYNWASDIMTNPNMWASPLYFPLAGSWTGSSGGIASVGTFWSSVVYSSFYAYRMNGLYSGTVTPATNVNRYVGFPVRCVAREAGSTPGIPVPPTAGKIIYHDNGANSPTKMSEQTPSTTVTEVALWPSNFQHTGGDFGFAGWNTKPDGTGTNYGPMETITLPSDFATNGLNLYAKWVPSAGNIQNWNGCSSLAQGAVTALKDTRDGNTYTVAKLADGKCWMIENLRLGGNSQMILTPDDTAISSNLTLPASTNTFTTANYTTVQINTNNTTSASNNMTTPNAYTYSYGNYYTWAAAIGSSAYYTTGNAPTSICPKGWQLPIGGNTTANKSFSYLDRQLGGDGGTQLTILSANRWRVYPNNFFYNSGWWQVNSASYNPVNDNGVIGYYWSSTSHAASGVYDLGVFSNSIFPGTGGLAKYWGVSVRCVAN